MDGGATRIIEWIRQADERTWFFVAWFALVAFFVVMLNSFYRKRTRRNFRGPDR